MKVEIVVKTNSRVEGVEAKADGSLSVRVNAPPVEGRANDRVIELLAQHFGVPKSKITLARGARGKRKVFQIG